MLSDLFYHIPPSLILILGAVFVGFLRSKYSRVFALVLPVAALLQVVNIAMAPDVDVSVINLAGFELKPVYENEFSIIFAVVFCIAVFGGMLFGLYQSKISETIFLFNLCRLSFGSGFCW